MAQLYTLNDVRQRNGKNGADTWIVIKDNVYDVTKYLNDHPGGAELITDVAGKDCTKEFEDAGHPSDAKQTMKTFKIGELIETDKRANRNKKPTTTESNDDSNSIKRRRRPRFFFCV